MKRKLTRSLFDGSNDRDSEYDEEKHRVRFVGLCNVDWVYVTLLLLLLLIIRRAWFALNQYFIRVRANNTTDNNGVLTFYFFLHDGDGGEGACLSNIYSIVAVITR